MMARISAHTLSSFLLILAKALSEQLKVLVYTRGEILGLPQDGLAGQAEHLQPILHDDLVVEPGVGEQGLALRPPIPLSSFWMKFNSCSKPMEARIFWAAIRGKILEPSFWQASSDPSHSSTSSKAHTVLWCQSWWNVLGLEQMPLGSVIQRNELVEKILFPERVGLLRIEAQVAEITPFLGGKLEDPDQRIDDGVGQGPLPVHDAEKVDGIPESQFLGNEARAVLGVLRFHRLPLVLQIGAGVSVVEDIHRPLRLYSWMKLILETRLPQESDRDLDKKAITYR